MYKRPASNSWLETVFWSGNNFRVEKVSIIAAAALASLQIGIVDTKANGLHHLLFYRWNETDQLMSRIFLSITWRQDSNVHQFQILQWLTFATKERLQWKDYIFKSMSLRNTFFNQLRLWNLATLWCDIYKKGRLDGAES